MTYVVMDTNCMIRAVSGKSPYSDAMARLKIKCDMIAYSSETMKECFGKLRTVGMTAYIFQRKLEDVRQLNKLKRASQTLVQRAKEEMRRRHLALPEDRYDVKFIVVAIAKSAKFIVTTDPHLLVLNPYRYGRSEIEIVPPQDYIPDVA